VGRRPLPDLSVITESTATRATVAGEVASPLIASPLTARCASRADARSPNRSRSTASRTRERSRREMRAFRAVEGWSARPMSCVSPEQSRSQAGRDGACSGVQQMGCTSSFPGEVEVRVAAPVDTRGCSTARCTRLGCPLGQLAPGFPELRTVSNPSVACRRLSYTAGGSRASRSPRRRSAARRPGPIHSKNSIASSSAGANVRLTHHVAGQHKAGDSRGQTGNQQDATYDLDYPDRVDKRVWRWQAVRAKRRNLGGVAGELARAERHEHHAGGNPDDQGGRCPEPRGGPASSIGSPMFDRVSVIGSRVGGGS
jgi:hypothetical protein